MLGSESIRRPTGWQATGAALIVAGFAVGLIVVIVIAAGPRDALQPQAGAPGVAANPNHSVLSVYRQAIGNLAVAVQRHDWPSMARFKQQLDNQMTAGTINAIYAERNRLLGNLAAAEGQHDKRAALAFRQQMTALCPSTEVTGAPAFCQ